MTKTTKTESDDTLVKSVDGVRWYTFYNNKDANVTLCSKEPPTRKEEVVLQHWGDYNGRKDIRYAKFDNYREAFRYIKYPINRAHDYSPVYGDRFFEYVRDGEMRPFFDIDMKMDCCSRSNTRRAAKVVAAFTSGLIKCFEETGYAIDPFDFRLYESCGECEDGYKYSYHIVLATVTLFNVAHVEVLAKAAAAKASALLGDLQYLLFNDNGVFVYDLKIYSSLRAFRLIRSSKDGETRIKKPFVDKNGTRVILALEGGKVVRYENEKVTNFGKAHLFVKDPAHAEELYDFQESLVGWYGQFKIPGSSQKLRPEPLGIEYFTPPPKKEYICENREFDVELVAEKFFQAYPHLEDVYKVDRGTTRLAAKKGLKICPCGGEHEGTGGGYLQSRGKKDKPYRYVFFCMQCHMASEPFHHEDGAEEAEEDEWKTEEEIEAERLAKEEAEEEEKARLLEKKEAMKAEMEGIVKAKYILPDEDEECPKYVGRESYTGFRERVNAPSIVDYIKEETSEKPEVQTEEEGAIELALMFSKIARKLSPFYKVSQDGDLFHYKKGGWTEIRVPKENIFSYIVHGEKDSYEVKVLISTTQILSGSFLRMKPFKQFPELVNDASEEWEEYKTTLPTIQCRYNYFKGQPVPLYNSRCVNIAPGFQAIPIFTDDYSEIEPLIEHIKYSHCAGNAEDFDGLMKINTYPMVNTHDPKSQRCPIIAGVGNCLKTQIWGELMLNVYGIHASASVDTGIMTADKNGILDNKTYLHADEPATSKGSKDNGLIEIFKRIITAKNINIRKLYNEGKPTSNVANLLVTSNTFDISFVDRKDLRRFLYLKAKVMAMLSNGVRIVASDETYEDVTYMKGGELSAEDKTLLKQETESQDSSIVTRYHNWMLDGLAGGLGHKSQRCADLFAGWLITNYGHIKFRDIPIQSLKAESRKEALKGLTGQVHKFFNALTSEDYNWYSLTKPYLIKGGGRKGKYHISKADIYQEFREFRKATSNGHSYDEAHFMTEFYSLVDKTDQIERCYRAWGDKPDNRVTVKGKKVAAGFYIQFADGFVIRDHLSPFNTKNRKLPTRNAAAADNKNPDDEEENEDEENEDEENEDEETDFSKPKKTTPEPTKSEDDPIITLKSSKKKTTETKKMPQYNIIPADQPDTSILQQEIQRLKEKAKKDKAKSKKRDAELKKMLEQNAELMKMMTELMAKK